MTRRAIEDEFSALNVSRQRKYQLRRRKEGKCILCNNKAFEESDFCLAHLKKKRVAQKLKRDKWRPVVETGDDDSSDSI